MATPDHTNRPLESCWGGDHSECNHWVAINWPAFWGEIAWAFAYAISRRFTPDSGTFACKGERE